ncbi:MAG: DMT family transporter [Asticcacaulis sp.]|nr:DMT family transporter [Asticcacaulis sp.]
MPFQADPASPTLTLSLKVLLNRWGGYILAALGAFLFASKGIWIKIAYGYHIDATSLLTVRLLLATPFFLVGGLITWLRQTSRGDEGPPPVRTRPDLYLKAMAAGALGYWFASWTDFESLVTLSPQFERLILFTYPLFVILFGALFFSQPMRTGALWTFAIAYAGIAFIFLTDLKAQGSVIVAGALWCGACSLAFAMYLLLAKPLIARLGASLFTSWAMGGAAIVTFTHFLLTHRLSAIPWSPGLLGICFGLAIGATVLPSYVTNFALGRISSQANAVISFINPVFTLILSILILRQHVSLADIVGTLLVMLGVGLYTWLDQRAARAAKA